MLRTFVIVLCFSASALAVPTDASFVSSLLAARTAPTVPARASSAVLRELLHNRFDDRFLALFPSPETFDAWLTSSGPAAEQDAIGQILVELRRARELTPEISELQRRFESLASSRDRTAWLVLYEKCFDALRSHRLAACPPIAFVERAPHIGGTNAIYFARVHIQGSSIRVLDRPGTEPRTIFQTRTGCVFDINPSYDGNRLVFTYRERAGEPFHLWEIGTDGKNLRQLTSGPYHDFNPVYYPDGRIVFSSSRVEAYSMCQNFLASALFICDADGSNIRRIDFTTLASSAPSILPDGTIAFTRWEYNDKNIFAWQGIWTIRPDGRGLRTLFGNTLIIPNSRFGPRPVPGTSKVVFTMAAHHFQPIGEIGLVDPQLGAENAAALQRLTWATNWKVKQGETWRDTRWGPGDKFFPWGWTTPWPINEDVSLASSGGQHESGPRRFQLYLLGHNARPVHLLGIAGTSLLHPVSLAPRELPPVVAGQVPTGKGTGTFYIADVYQGLTEQGVTRGQVKELRIWEQLPKKYNTEGPRLLDEYPVIGYGTYYVKKLHGSVPVKPNGSAYFKAPAGIELYFQAVDEHGREIRRMGTVTQITTGERASCVGCHENRHTAPPSPTAGTVSDRVHGAPSEITPPSWGAGTIDYASLVQPVLDRYCVSCHQGPRPDGNINLSGDKTRFFSVSYETLCRSKWIEYYHLNGGPTGIFPALATGSYASRLTRLIESKHAKVDVDPESRKRLYAWIDANVPYYGTWDMDRPHTTGGHDVAQRLEKDDGVYPKIGRSRKPEFLPWFVTIQAIVEKRKLPRGLLETGLNLTHPEHSPLLLDHLAQSAGGRASEKQAIFKTTTDPDYRALLKALQGGARTLHERPRIEMPGGKALPQERDFGRVF